MLTFVLEDDKGDTGLLWNIQKEMRILFFN